MPQPPTHINNEVGSQAEVVIEDHRPTSDLLPPVWSVLMKWIVAHILVYAGWLVVTRIFILTVTALPQSDQSGFMVIGYLVIAGSVISTVAMAVFLGLGQSFALGSTIKTQERRDWFWATGRGFLAAFVLNLVFGIVFRPSADTVALLFAGSICVLAVSVNQLEPLEKIVPQAGWWIPANFMGVAAGVAMSIVVLSPGTTPLAIFTNSVQEAAGAVLAVGVGVATFAAITGVALVYLLRHRRPN